MKIAPLPSNSMPLVETSRAATSIWRLWFAQFTNPAAAITAVKVTASPFAYTASQSGSLAISGGTVSAVTLTRTTTTAGAKQSASVGLTGGLVPCANGDVVTITYSVAPTVSFIPS